MRGGVRALQRRYRPPPLQPFATADRLKPKFRSLRGRFRTLRPLGTSLDVYKATAPCLRHQSERAEVGNSLRRSACAIEAASRRLRRGDCALVQSADETNRLVSIMIILSKTRCARRWPHFRTTSSRPRSMRRPSRRDNAPLADGCVPPSSASRCCAAHWMDHGDIHAPALASERAQLHRHPVLDRDPQTRSRQHG